MKNNRILVIDDNPAIHADIRKILDTGGSNDTDAADLFLGINTEDKKSKAKIEYEITSAYQGQEGVELAQKAFDQNNQFAMAFVDMRMPPGWDGLRTVKEIWKIDPTLQVVICTAFSDHSWQDLQNELGKTDSMLILKKPFDTTEVSQLAVALTEKWHLQRELEDALKKAIVANDAKSQFVATMSHELRTPLNGILGMTQLLSSTPLNDRQRTYLEACQTSGESLLTVIGSILDFSKIESEFAQLELAPTNLFQLVEGVTQSIGSDLAKRKPNVDLTCLIDPQIPIEIIADSGKLQQLLFNLGGNAAKFTEEGNVSISARCMNLTDDDVTIEFSIKDTGIGIPEDRIETIFEPFSQADNQTTRKYGGTGLGLNICQRFVRLMGSEFNVTSTLNQGSEFSFTAKFLRSLETDASPSYSVPAGINVGVVGLHALTEKHLNELLTKLNIGFRNIYFRRCDDIPQDISDLNYIFVDYRGEPTHFEATLYQLKECKHKSDVGIIPICHAGQELSVKQSETFSLLPPLIKPICQSRIVGFLNSAPMTLSKKSNEKPESSIVKMQKSSGINRNLKVLLVEDNEINQMFAESLFDEAKFEYSTCNNGQEAVDLVRDNDDFDVILMDCQMPVMDGIEATGIIKGWMSEGEVKDIPIIALTANAISTARDACLEAGMSEYISKPFQIEDLFEAIDRCLNDFDSSGLNT